LHESGDLAEAEAQLLTALSLQDGYLPRTDLARLYMRQGLLDKAEQVHLEGLRLRSDSRKRIEAYADFLSDVGRETEATEQYARAAKLPED
jgi:Tfp pilus assembly protein PilF